MNMNAMSQQRPRAAARSLALTALLCVSAASWAYADEILVAQTNLVTGTASAVDSFTAPAAGTVTVQLSNLAWPTALSSLSFFASSSSQVLASGIVPENMGPTGPSGGTVVESFQVTPGTYFAHVTGAATGPLDLGLYSMQVTFAPAVPLPATAGLLACGLLLLAGLGRRLGFLRPHGSLPAAA
jgi:hypothetical protein